MERIMTTELVHRAALPDREVTLLEIQRWEDDGGAVLPGRKPPLRRSVFHLRSTERFHCSVSAELAAAD